MSDDLIRRSDAIKVIDRMKHRLIGNGCTYEFIRQMIEELPTIEPKRGEWIGTRIGHYPGYECSLCHYGVQPWNNTDFCPNCGADMRGKGDE